MQSDTNLARTTPTTTALFNPRRRANAHSLVRAGPSYTKLKDHKNSATGQGTVQLLLAGQEAFATNGYMGSASFPATSRHRAPSTVEGIVWKPRAHPACCADFEQEKSPAGRKDKFGNEVGCPG